MLLREIIARRAADQAFVSSLVAFRSQNATDVPVRFHPVSIQMMMSVDSALTPVAATVSLSDVLNAVHSVVGAVMQHSWCMLATHVIRFAKLTGSMPTGAVFDQECDAHSFFDQRSAYMVLCLISSLTDGPIRNRTSFNDCNASAAMIALVLKDPALVGMVAELDMC